MVQFWLLYSFLTPCTKRDTQKCQEKYSARDINKEAIFVLLGFLLENILLHFESHKHMLHVATVVTDSEQKKMRNKMSAKKGGKKRKKERKMDLYESGI